MTRDQSLSSSFSALALGIQSEIGRRAIPSSASAYSVWMAPPAHTPLTLLGFSLSNLTTALYANPEATDANIVFVWNRCCALFRQARHLIAPTLSTLLPHVPFRGGDSELDCARDMALALSVLGLTRKFELTTHTCRIRLGREKVGFDHRGVELRDGGYRLLPERYIGDYRQIRLMKLGVARPVSGRLTSLIRYIEQSLPLLVDELDVLFSSLMHAGPEHQAEFVQHFNVVPATGDEQVPEKPTPPDPAQLAAIQFQRQLGRL